MEFEFLPLKFDSFKGVTMFNVLSPGDEKIVSLMSNNGYQETDDQRQVKASSLKRFNALMHGVEKNDRAALDAKIAENGYTEEVRSEAKKYGYKYALIYDVAKEMHSVNDALCTTVKESRW